MGDVKFFGAGAKALVREYWFAVLVLAVSTVLFLAVVFANHDIAPDLNDRCRETGAALLRARISVLEERSSRLESEIQQLERKLGIEDLGDAREMP